MGELRAAAIYAQDALSESKKGGTAMADLAKMFERMDDDGLLCFLHHTIFFPPELPMSNRKW